jgi:hypothetical protein
MSAPHLRRPYVGRRVVTHVGPDLHRPPSSEAARAGLSHNVDLPIDIDDVRIIASEGFPLWEPVEVMVQRNRRITLGYADLSRRLADVIADGGDRDANWCTFATWSSKTIGTWIESIPFDDPGSPPSPSSSSSGAGPSPGRHSPSWPITFATVKALGRFGEAIGLGPAVSVIRGMTDRGKTASYRALATGNRAVFLEIGLAVATFLDHFPKRSAALGPDADDQWTACWDRIAAQLDELSLLDPSWLLTARPPAEELRHGVHQYFKALRTDDPGLRAQLVLAGNLLVAAYEQRRVQGYVCAALALFTERAMQGLIRDRSGAVDGLLQWPSRMFARYVTGQMALRLVDEPIWLCHPLAAPADPDDRWDALATNADVTLPLLQVLITRYQLAIGRHPNRGATDWTCFDQRMRTIGNLFRLRQHQRALFDAPFTPAESALLFAPTP